MLNEIIAEMLPSGFPEHRRHKIAFSIVGQCLIYRVCNHVVGMLIGSEERNKSFVVDQLAEHIVQFSLGGIEQAKRESEAGKA